jgi:polar amino acid transport system substrate-binding protein
MARWLAGLFLVVTVIFAVPTNTRAQAPQASGGGRPLDVSVRQVTPFVMTRNGNFEGFSIELWNALARSMNVRTNYSERDTLANLLDAVAKKEVDLAIAAISITSQREERFDFSQPMFESGLQIMVRQEAGNSLGLNALIAIFTTGIMPYLLGGLALLILIPAHIMWLVERGHQHSIVSRSYFPGIFHALWWATGAAHGQQLNHPQSAIGKAISALAIFISVIFLAFFTANVTSTLTVQQLKSDINGPEDLPGKRVATVTNSTAANYLRSRGVTLVERPRIDEAFALLIDKQVDAVLFDAPVLLYYAANDGRNKVQVVGSVFRRESYGILFPQGSVWRKPVNEALLKLREDGTYETIYRKWFGALDK